MKQLRFIFAAAVMTAALVMVSGCAMKWDIARLESKLDSLQVEQRQMIMTTMRLDSLLNSESEASLKLRAEIRSSLTDLTEQVRIMQATMNDLQDRVRLIGGSQTGGRTVAVTPPAGADTSAAAAATPSVDCQTLYDDSFVNIRREKYEDAIRGFNDFLKYCGTHEAAADARFWIGEAYYSMENYKEAIAQFEMLIKDYPKSVKRAGAMYKMARSHEELGQKNEAKKNFEKLIDEFPSTLEASQAKQKLKDLK